MYLPSHFAEARPEVLHACIEEHPFGLLVTQNGTGGVEANSLPFIHDAGETGEPGVLRGHVARANLVWSTARGDVESLVVFQGPHGYVSPSWYPSKVEHGKVVPTWNYVMVQGRGQLRAIEDPAWLRQFVARLTDRHEQGRPQPWAVTDAPADYLEAMLRAIVGIEIVLTSLVGKWKVSQNRPEADRQGVARSLAAEPGSDAALLARQVRSPGAAT